jgi:hypothetical protein
MHEARQHLTRAHAAIRQALAHLAEASAEAKAAADLLRPHETDAYRAALARKRDHTPEGAALYVADSIVDDLPYEVERLQAFDLELGWCLGPSPTRAALARIEAARQATDPDAIAS